MKKALLAIALVCIATASFGWVGVTWTAFKLLDANGGGSTTIYGNSATTKVLWELVYTTKSSMADPTMNKATGEITYQEGDVTWATRTWTPDKNTEMHLSEYVMDGVPNLEKTLTIKYPNGAIKTEGGSDYKNDSLTLSSGQVYAAVFQYLEDGSVYWATTGLGEFGTNEMVPTPSLGGDAWSEPVTLSYFGKVTPVPEPATMSLLGLGALAMVIRRKLRK